MRIHHIRDDNGMSSRRNPHIRKSCVRDSIAALYLPGSFDRTEPVSGGFMDGPQVLPDAELRQDLRAARVARRRRADVFQSWTRLRRAHHIRQLHQEEHQHQDAHHLVQHCQLHDESALRCGRFCRTRLHG